MEYTHSYFSRRSGLKIVPQSLNSVVFYTRSDLSGFSIGDRLVGSYDRLYRLVKAQHVADDIYEVTLLPYEEPQP